MHAWHSVGISCRWLWLLCFVIVRPDHTAVISLALYSMLFSLCLIELNVVFNILNCFPQDKDVVFPTVHYDEEAYAMYSEYARKTSFSVRKQHIFYCTHTRIIKGREYSCSKAGLKRSSTNWILAQIVWHALTFQQRWTGQELEGNKICRGAQSFTCIEKWVIYWDLIEKYRTSKLVFWRIWRESVLERSTHTPS